MFREIPTPREWSNTELRRALAQLPNVRRAINVSGWQDKDKSGATYRSYLPDNVHYDISNYGADLARGGAGTVSIDLSEPLPEGLAGSYGLAINHTVLEHVIDPHFAFAQIAKLSRDLVITVVPFKQKLHFEAGMYGDYYRFTPFSMRRLHELNGLTVLYESFTPRPSLDVYLFYVGTKTPEAHSGFARKLPPIESLNFQVGEFRAGDLLLNAASRFWGKFIRRRRNWREP